MRRVRLTFAGGIALLALTGLAQQTGPYKVLKTAKIGGAGGFDYVYADADGRRLYIPRTGPAPRDTVFNLETLEPAGEIADANARGAAVDPKTGHGFASSKPAVMWDTKTLATIETIDRDGGPDGILYDPLNARVWVFSHRTPNATVINAADGTVAGTVDLGGAPEQAVSDGEGHLYMDIEDKDNVAVVDAKELKTTAHYDLGGTGTDGATFNPNTMEAFSSNGDGTLTVIKEDSPARFVVEQNVQTMRGAKTLTLGPKTNRVLLIAAEYGAPPTPATPPKPGGRRGRGQMVPDSFSIVVVGK